MIIRLFKKKIDFSLPKKNQVIVYDDVNSEVFKYFFKNYFSLNVRKNYIYFAILLKTIFTSGFKNLYFNYQIEVIKYINPKLIITFVDNSIYFFLLKRALKGKKIKFISIQNGLRIAGDIFDRNIDSLNHNKGKLEADYLFVLGKNDNKKYEKYFSGKIIEHGSLRSNLVPVSKNKFLDDQSITFISDYSYPVFGEKKIKIISEKKEISWKRFYTCEKFIIPFLVKFCQTNGYRLNIALRLKKNASKEISFYNNLVKEFNFKVNFLKNYDIKTNYKRIDNSNLIVFISSTLGYEALSRGTKVFVFGVRSLAWNSKLNCFGWPFYYKKNGLFWSNEFNEKVWSNQIKKVLDLKRETWLRKNKTFKNSLIKADFDNKLLRSVINEII